MPRYKLTIEYDGTPYRGWQRQRDLPSVAQAIEEAITLFSGEVPLLQAAGRTDAGVHALAQIAHFDLERVWTPDTVRDAINHHLRPQPIAIIAAETVSTDFEARFSAKGRRYQYRILNRRPRSALDAFRVWHVPVALDAEAMHAAAQTILGTHDFSTFRASDCQARSPVKTLDRLDVMQDGGEIVVYAGARSFLHHQVRAMVGSLRQVGEGRWPISGLRAALDARERARCGAMAPAHGLYLTGVDY